MCHHLRAYLPVRGRHGRWVSQAKGFARTNALNASRTPRQFPQRLSGPSLAPSPVRLPRCDAASARWPRTESRAPAGRREPINKPYCGLGRPPGVIRAGQHRTAAQSAGENSGS
jgi:hypothetical protein